MSERPLYACRVTRGLLASERMGTKVAERLSALFEEWSLDPDEATAGMVYPGDGGEITLHVEPYQDGMSCTATVERIGLYRVDASGAMVRRVPDTIAQATIAGAMSVPKLIGKGLVDGVGIRQVIRKGIVYEKGEQVDDLTSVQSTPPWSQDESLSIRFAVENEGFHPISLPGTKGMKQIVNCGITQRFLDEGAEDFLASYRYVVEMGESMEGDEEHIWFKRGETEHTVNGSNVDLGKGRVLFIEMVVAVRERYYLREESLELQGLPTSVQNADHVGRLVSELLTSEWPPEGTRVTGQKTGRDALGIEFKKDLQFRPLTMSAV